MMKIHALTDRWLCRVSSAIPNYVVADDNDMSVIEPVKAFDETAFPRLPLRKSNNSHPVFHAVWLRFAKVRGAASR